MTPKQTDIPGRLAYELCVSTPIPSEISLVLGDLVHNLRSALDSLIFELARIDSGGTLTEAEQRVTQFVLFETPGEFDQYFSRGRVRSKIFTSLLRRTLRPIQPFYHLEQAQSLGIDLDEDDATQYALQYMNSPLAEIVRISNLDKHRRLSVLAWAVDLVWWTTSGPETTKRTWIPASNFARSNVVGYLTGEDLDGGPLEYEPVLALEDLPVTGAGATPRDVLEIARHWVGATQRGLEQLILDWTRLKLENPSNGVIA